MGSLDAAGVRHPKVSVLESQSSNALLQLRQSIFMISLRQGSDVRNLGYPFALRASVYASET